jgi:hypothetical protein
VAAYDGDLLAVIRVIEIANEFRFKVGELFSRRTVKILDQRLSLWPSPRGINDAVAVAHEHDAWRPSLFGWRPNSLALPRKRIGVHVDADDGGVREVVAENLAEIGSVGGHRFRSRLA